MHITVAGPGGQPLESEVLKNLRRAIDAVRDPAQDIIIARVDPAKSGAFNVSAQVLIKPGYLWDKVRRTVEDTLRVSFAFDNRQLGQPVTAAEIMAVIQACEGVEAARLKYLYLDGETPTLNSTLDARQAYLDESVDPPIIRPAEIRFINPGVGGIECQEWVG